jgi:hypothetical protein
VNVSAATPAQRFESIFRNALAKMVGSSNKAHASSMAHTSRFEKERECIGQACWNTVARGISAENQRWEAELG